MLCGLGFRLRGYSPNFVPNSKERKYANLNDFWVTVTIEALSHVTGPLSRAVCPFVRMHVVNLHSGRYITTAEQQPQQPVGGGGEGGGAVNEPSVVVPPLNSRAYSMRSDETCPRWTDTLTIRARFSDVLDPNTLVLFEILDNPPAIRKSGGSNARRKSDYSDCLAWGFLLPRGNSQGNPNVALPDETTGRSGGGIGSALSSVGVGAAEGGVAEGEASGLLEGEERRSVDGVNFRPLRIQLYEYREETWLVEGIQRRMLGWPSKARNVFKTQRKSRAGVADEFAQRIPDVYFQWRRQRHVKAGGVLNVLVSYTHRPSIAAARALAAASDGGIQGLSPTSDSEGGRGGRAGGDMNRLGSSDSTDRGGGGTSTAKEEALKAAIRAAVNRRSRSELEPSVLPNRLLRRGVEAGGKDGSVVCRFSHQGTLLAIASVSPRLDATAHISSLGASGYPGTLYALSIYDSDTGDLLWCDEYAHFGIIYDVKWSPDDRSIVTCSSDGRCKLYEVAMLSRGFRDMKAGQGDSHARHDSRRYSLSASPNRSGKAPGVGAQGTAFNVVSATIMVSKPVIFSSSPPAFVYAVALVESLGIRRQRSGARATVTGNTGAGESKEGRSVSPPRAASSPEVQPAHRMRVLSGSSDGRIRVFEVTGTHCGELLTYDPTASASGSAIFAPHEGAVHDLVVDPKSKYLFSGDSVGAILVWRMDSLGWYQLMRRLRKDDLLGLSIRSMSIYTTNPSVSSAVSSTSAARYASMQGRSYLLVAASAPLVRPELGEIDDPTVTDILASKRPVLQLYDLSSYKVVMSYSSFAPPVAFSRASFSSDGRYISACVVESANVPIAAIGSFDPCMYSIRVWDTFTGHIVRHKFCELRWTVPVRCVSWHPSQHMVVVSVCGPDAATSVFVAEKLGAQLAVSAMLEQEAIEAARASKSAFFAGVTAPEENSENVLPEGLNSTAENTLTAGSTRKKPIVSSIRAASPTDGAARAGAALGPVRVSKATAATGVSESERGESNEAKMQRIRGILDRVKAKNASGTSINTTT
jgi:WD40 repeat protein